MFCRIVISGTCVPSRLGQDYIITIESQCQILLKKNLKNFKSNVRSILFKNLVLRRTCTCTCAHVRTRVGAHVRTYTPHSRVCHKNAFMKQCYVNVYIWKRFHLHQSEMKALTLESVYTFDIVRQIPTNWCRNVEWKRLLSTNIAKSSIKRFQLVSSVIIPERLKTA